MVILHTTHTKQPKIEDIPITQYHLEHHIQIVTNEAFTIEGQPGQVISFISLIHMSTQIMSFIPPTLLLAIQKDHHIQGEQFMRAICYHPS